MRKDFIFGKYDKQLGDFINLVQACPVEKRKVVPPNFLNSVYWQLGHLLVVTEFHVYELSGQAKSIPAEYFELFEYGTKPGDWNGEPPAWDSLIEQLHEQRKRIHDTLGDKLDSPVPESFLEARTWAN